jgi:hypothetical protein
VDQTRLAEIEGRLAEYRSGAMMSGPGPHRSDYARDVAALLTALRDALDLLGRVACDERHAAEVGAARERGAIADDLLRWAIRDPEPQDRVALRAAADRLRARGPCLPALPAEVLAAENGRLREVLAGLVAAVRNEMAAANLPAEWAADSAMGRAVSALGEGG